MDKKKVPHYFVFRIYLLAVLFYFFLLLSVVLFIFIKNAPSMILKFDLLQDVKIELNEGRINPNEQHLREQIEKRLHEKNFEQNFLIRKLLLIVFFQLTVGFCITLAINLPFKYYFFRLRKKKTINDRLKKYCQKILLYTPLLNAVILTLVFLLFHLLLLLRLNIFKYENPVLNTIQLNLLFISLISSLLALLLVYFWQKYRVQIKYMEFIFSQKELQRLPDYHFKSSKIQNRLILSSIMITLLPLATVVFYVLLSFSVVDDVNSLNKSQLKILFTDIYQIFDSLRLDEYFYHEIYENKIINHYGVLYMPTINSIQMLFGLLSGVLITLVYIFFFVRWTTASIIYPINELLKNIKMTAQGQLDHYAIVRTTDEIGELSQGYNQMLKGLKEKAKIKSLFGQYLTKEVSEEILNGNVNLGGDLYEATVMFTDIRNFTHISEKISPVEVVTFLNSYLDQMIDVIIEYDGIIDKFIGDGILAIFGVPLKSENHAKNAVNAALVMQKKLNQLNEARIAGGDFPIRIGIGIHSGTLIAGNIGNEKKLEYTVIGDTVNIASRIEKLTKEYQTEILISETTYHKLNQSMLESFQLNQIPNVRIRGKTEKFTLYTL